MISADSKEGTESVGKVKRSKRKQVDILTIGLPPPISSKGRRVSPDVAKYPPKERKREYDSTSSRPAFFLIGKAPVSLVNTKLQKRGPVLERLLSEMETSGVKDATEIINNEVKSVWFHHFGPRLIMGLMNMDWRQSMLMRN